MRKILITIRLVLISMLANAMHQSSQLCIFDSENKIISVSFDQSAFSIQGRSLTINQVEPGYHYLYVVGYPGRFRHPSRPVVLFSNYIYFPPSSKVTAGIESNRSFTVYSVEPFYHERSRYEHDDNCKRDNGRSVADAARPMCAPDFVQLKNSIASKAFESSKQQIAEQALSSNLFLAEQVAALIQLMSFESTRLELAKFAYAHTVDKENYYRVNDSFNFESSIVELNHFIRDRS